MDLYYNNQKASTIQILPAHTAGQIKQILHNWLIPQGIVNYSVRIVFSDGTELAPIVLTTNQYDHVNFQGQANILTGGRIDVTPVVPATRAPTTGHPKNARSQEYIVPANILPTIAPHAEETANAFDDEEIPIRLDLWVRNSRLPVKRGDTINLYQPQNRYRNDGTYFVDEVNGEIVIIEPDYEPDDYGTTPRQFKFPEFPIKYFEDVIAHNKYMWLDDRFRAEIARNLQLGIPRINFTRPPTSPILYSWFTYNGERYWVLGMNDNCGYASPGARQSFLDDNPHDFGNWVGDYEVSPNEENIIYKLVYCP